MALHCDWREAAPNLSLGKVTELHQVSGRRRCIRIVRPDATVYSMLPSIFCCMPHVPFRFVGADSSAYVAGLRIRRLMR